MVFRKNEPGYGLTLLMSLFLMQVKDTFHLADGRTVFIGSVKTEAKNISSCDCEILVENEVKGSLRIDGEEVPKDKRVADRAISTTQRIDLASLGVGKGDFIIRSKI